MERNTFFILLLFIYLLSRGEGRSIDSFKILAWSMGSGNCRDGQTWPDCDTYIFDSVNKMIEVGPYYDIICLKEFPRYYRNKQKAVSEKLINQLVLKQKFSVFRKNNSDIAILSRFPVQQMGQIDLTKQYGAQRIKFTIGAKKYQVANIFNLKEVIADLNKENVGKILRWMNQPSNRGDINILAGDFNIPHKVVEDVIKSVNPFDFTGVPARSCFIEVCIYAWGESGWPFSNPDMSPEDHIKGVAYTKILGGSYPYIPNRVVTIQNSKSYLATNGAVYGDSFQWAHFGTKSYLKTHPQHQYKFIVETLAKGSIRISSPYDGVSYLALNNPISVSHGYSWAKFASWEYLQNSTQKDPRFTFNQYTNELQSNYSSYPSYLTPSHSPATDQEWALFVTDPFFKDDPKRYSKTIYIKDIKNR